MQNSPNLRSVWETARQNDLQPTVPDLLNDLGRLRISGENNPPPVEGSLALASNAVQTRRVVRAGTRVRTLSLAPDMTPTRQQRRARCNSVSEMPTNRASPLRQLRISDIGNENDNDFEELCEELSKKNIHIGRM